MGKPMVDPEVLKRYVRANHNPDAPENRGCPHEAFMKASVPNPNVIIRDIESSKHLTKKQIELLKKIKARPVTA
jgi:hypothetical protein